jgi:hypothetical protein
LCGNLFNGDICRFVVFSEPLIQGCR